MPDKLTATTPLGGYAKNFNGTELAETTGLAIVSLACPRGGDAALATAVKSAWGLDMPAPGMSAEAGGVRVIWSSPDQSLVVFPHATPDAMPHVKGLLGDAAYLTDQTDNWCALSIEGSLARTALERICPLDIHDQAFAVNATARTVMEHLGVFITRTGDDAFMLLSGSSSAGSFLHAVELSLKNVS